MKTGWEVKPLGEVVDVIGGGTPSKRTSGYYDGNIPWATVRDMKEELLSTTEFRINQKALKESSAKVIPSGEIIIATRVGLGKVCRLLQDTAINQDLRGLLPLNGNQLDRQYLFYWLKSIGDKIVAAGTGATVHGVKLPFIKSLPLPPLEEQRRIVAILDEAFEGLSRARANTLANLEDARALFEARLNNIFNEISRSNDHKRLADVAIAFGRGRSRHRPRNAPHLYGGPYPFIQTGKVRNAAGLLTDFDQTYSEAGLAQSKLWPSGTVCITIAANIAETAVLGIDACFPDSIIGMIPDPEKCVSDYIEYMLRYYSTRLKSKGKGSAQDNINLATFETEVFPIPSVEIQMQIVSILAETSSYVAELYEVSTQKLTDLDNLRQSLLQKAFAGELT